MRVYYTPICHFCKHFYPNSSYSKRRGGNCAAFPDGIPKLIIDLDYDHRETYPGDNGIQFEIYDSRETLHVDLSEESDETIHQHLKELLPLMNEYRSDGGVLPPFIDEAPEEALQILKDLYKRQHLPPDDSEDLSFWSILIDETIVPAWLLKMLIESTEDVIKNRQNQKDEDE